LTIDEEADALRVSRRTIYAVLARGDLRSLGIGTRQRIPAEEIARLIGRQETAGGAVATANSTLAMTVGPQRLGRWNIPRSMLGGSSARVLAIRERGERESAAMGCRMRPTTTRRGLRCPT